MSNYIYAYTHSGNARKWKRATGQNGDFWIKVGQSTKPYVARVKEQVNTAFPGLDGVHILFHSELAERPDGSPFSDHDVHRVLTGAGIAKAGGEWFEANLHEVLGAVVSLQKSVPFNPDRVQTFHPRPEQKHAVEQTAAYFRNHDGDEPAPKYLWNAKMRFGKTFTTYQLAREMGWEKVLVLTYKPAVRSAWRDDLLGHTDFIDWRYIDRDTPSADADDIVDGNKPFVWFASFQDVTGRNVAGRPKLRNETLHIVDWDCIVIDEFHFGAATATARELYDPQDKVEAEFAKLVEKALDQGNDNDAELIDPDFGLTTRFHLHLSGTPFKAITNGDYAEDQVFNWTYIDEQRSKLKAEEAGGNNPYAELPRMEMYTYSMGDVAGAWAGDGEFDGFDLNTYFKARQEGDDPVFENPDYVASFLDLIRGKKQQASRIIEGKDPPRFPYEDAKFKQAVQHSVWYLPDVGSCEAMAKLLQDDVFFSTYEIYVAAGTKAKIGAAALEPLKKAIGRAETDGKSGSIALSCGKLMTGVTVPEWSSIFMLRSLKAPESYFQAAFRVQSPWKEDSVIKKETAYIFEFDPNRALNLVALYGTELANNSGARDTTQRDVLSELINFLPIFAIDGGQMEQLNTDAILDWANGGISANSLARKWRSVDLYNLNGVTMGLLLEDEELLAELEQIEDFRNIREEAAKVVTASNKLGDIKRAGGPKSEQRKPKSELAKQRRDIREKLKKVSAKVLIFMYVTDVREERLLHVIESLDTELFLRSTGLSLEGFRKLTEAGVFNIAQMNDAIQKFRYFERKSLESFQ